MTRSGPAYLALGLASGATLLYEVALTRLFAVAQGYHFGFLAISLALLGFGASGTALALARKPRAGQTDLAALGLLLSLALPGSYLLANHLPFDAYRLAWEPIQYLYLAAYLLALAAPFFLTGLLQGLPLIVWTERTASWYAANLLGSGLGCLLALGVLTWTSVEGAVAMAGLLASGSALGFTIQAESTRHNLRRARSLRWSAAAAAGLCAVLLLQTPAWFEVRLSPYKPLRQMLNDPEARVVARYENALARLEVVDTPRLRSAPGLSLAFGGTMPRQTALVVDAETVLPLTALPASGEEILNALPMALPYRLRPGARTLILNPGGGLDVLVALHHGAKSVTAVEPNNLVADMIQGPFADRAGRIYAEPRVNVVRASGRAYTARSTEPFDIVALSLSDNFRAVSAGAFALSEDYRLTVEAFRSYLSRLAPRGLLVIHRWLQLPPTEEVRAAGLALAALEAEGAAAPARNIVALRSFSTLLLLAQREPFKAGEIDEFKTFARERQFDLVYYPGIQRGEANRYQILPSDDYFDAFQSLVADAPRFYREYAFEVTPPVDDRPYFFHLFRWEQTPTVLALLGKTWQPFGGGGYLTLLALFGLALVLSLGLILLPVLVRRGEAGAAYSRSDTSLRAPQGRSNLSIPQRLLRRPFGAPRNDKSRTQEENPSPDVQAVRPRGRLKWLAYFAALGCGYLFVEIPLIQQMSLFLDYSVLAFTVVLCGLLIFSGLGSLSAARVPWRGALATLVLAALVYPALWPQIVAACLGQPLITRVMIALILLAPLGWLLGVPFPRGLRLLSVQAPELTPLVWAVNGFASVLSSILATLLALAWGLTIVWLVAAATYALALASLWRGNLDTFVL